MAKKEKVKAILLRKGEVVRLLGYSASSGYRYIDYLIENEMITQKFLPGVSKPRFLRTEVESLLEDSKHEGVPAFEPLEGQKWN
jgi:predicted DNA-binding transcriptional regulator AlpA